RIAADPRPWMRSSGRTRILRRSDSFARAIFPSTNPVRVMRSQKRWRAPRNVNAKRPNAIARPIATTALLPRRKRRDQQADDHERSEGGVQLRGLQVDHRDRALLPGCAELRRADLTHEERQR